MALYQFTGVPLSAELSREERRECPANTYDKICICQLIQVDCLQKLYFTDSCLQYHIYFRRKLAHSEISTIHHRASCRGLRFRFRFDEQPLIGVDLCMALVNKRIRGIHILFFQNKLKLFLSKNMRAIVLTKPINYCNCRVGLRTVCCLVEEERLSCTIAKLAHEEGEQNL